jgi:propanol-preferring alcohol dehydrogenase
MFRATGRDINGGYRVHDGSGKLRVSDSRSFSDIEAAPLLCAGTVGYRTLKLTGLQDEQLLGLTGFGSLMELKRGGVRGAKVLVVGN